MRHPIDRAAVVRRVALAAREQAAASAARTIDTIRRIGTIGRSTLQQRLDELVVDALSQLFERDAFGTPPALLRLTARTDDEKPYNRYLGWLFDPGRNHRAAIPALTALARMLHFDTLLRDLEAPKAVSTIEARCERCWPDEVGSMQEPDLLVISPHALLLLENKVQSGESGDQYGPYRQDLDTLAKARKIDPLDARAHLLAPDSRPAATGWGFTLTHGELALMLVDLAACEDLPAWDRVLCYQLADAFRGADIAELTSRLRALLSELRSRPAQPGDARRLMDLGRLPPPFRWRPLP